MRQGTGSGEATERVTIIVRGTYMARRYGYDMWLVGLKSDSRCDGSSGFASFVIRDHVLPISCSWSESAYHACVPGLQSCHRLPDMTCQHSSDPDDDEWLTSP